MLERMLGPEVAANRTRRGRALALRPWRAERAVFETRRRILVGGSPLTVKTDVRECYPSIRPDVAERSLGRLGAWRRDVAPLRSMLERLEEGGVVGLPVGPEPSAVIANAVLAVADHAVRRASARHLRWVDDIWAEARDERHVEEVLDRLRVSLEAIGLSLNDHKTRVLDRGGARELIRVGDDAEGYR
jgi:hypothetical protein